MGLWFARIENWIKCRKKPAVEIDWQRVEELKGQLGKDLIADYYELCFIDMDFLIENLRSSPKINLKFYETLNNLSRLSKNIGFVSLATAANSEGVKEYSSIIPQIEAIYTDCISTFWDEYSDRLSL